MKLDKSKNFKKSRLDERRNESLSQLFVIDRPSTINRVGYLMYCRSAGREHVTVYVYIRLTKNFGSFVSETLIYWIVMVWICYLDKCLFFVFQTFTVIQRQ